MRQILVELSLLVCFTIISCVYGGSSSSDDIFSAITSEDSTISENTTTTTDTISTLIAELTLVKTPNKTF